MTNRSKTSLLIASAFVLCTVTHAQPFPAFGPEIPVQINGLTFDAMEAAVSADGNYLFFNSLNDGITTSLYYATRVNDSTYTYVGALTGANQTVTPRLDAVASSDAANNFYWTSLRDFPIQFDNCLRGSFTGSNVVLNGRVHGSLYIYTLGWLMMDACINYQGDLLYYTNAYFGPNYTGCGGVPCIGRLGVAQKINDSTFNKLPNSETLLQSLNDTNYVVYAPCISKDGLELYYTRFQKNNIQQGTQICLAVRSNTVAAFSNTSIIHPFSAEVPEAVTLSTDQSKLYYHKKVNGLYKLVVRYRTSTNSLTEQKQRSEATCFPNPSNQLVHISPPQMNASFEVQLYSQQGVEVFSCSNCMDLSLTELPQGIYILHLRQSGTTTYKKIIKH